MAFATAEEYELELLKQALLRDDLYEPCGLGSGVETCQLDEVRRVWSSGGRQGKRNRSSQRGTPPNQWLGTSATFAAWEDPRYATGNRTRFILVGNDSNVVHAVAKYHLNGDHREIFFFREGSVVLWNITELESFNVLSFLRKFEKNSYDEKLVQNENELMMYTYKDNSKLSHVADGAIHISEREQNDLDKYTVSNAMAHSVKLGIWEATLDNYIDSIEYVTNDLKKGVKIKISQEEVLRRTGELLALRHHINLDSDLLDTPDFYWDHEQQEKLYEQTCSYFNIARRTRVMNEKLNHCVELVELLSSHLSDRHHVRLEWMIIILIMVEVVFEALHFVEQHLS
ncbi:hypothetical protein PR048_032097 [Dryococelus australis]|uniref:DUF155 domain-containing protein n=1 Tax=Dryococelus australis TaxID=614101 RepID=A0ABQ9G1A0_9NEOP|nr:hypothetical protein PR048_032097 [Dryococelus australis]